MTILSAQISLRSGGETLQERGQHWRHSQARVDRQRWFPLSCCHPEDSVVEEKQWCSFKGQLPFLPLECIAKLLFLYQCVCVLEGVESSLHWFIHSLTSSLTLLCLQNQNRSIHIGQTPALFQIHHILIFHTAALLLFSLSVVILVSNDMMSRGLTHWWSISFSKKKHVH